MLLLYSECHSSGHIELGLQALSQKSPISTTYFLKYLPNFLKTSFLKFNKAKILLNFSGKNKQLLAQSLYPCIELIRVKLKIMFV